MEIDNIVDAIGSLYLRAKQDEWGEADELAHTLGWDDPKLPETQWIEDRLARLLNGK